MAIRMCKRFGVVASLVMWCAGGVAAGAQQVREHPSLAVIPALPSDRTGDGRAVMNTPLDIDVVSVPLRVALDEIVRQSGVRVLYSADVLPMDRRVSVRGSRITLDSALRVALSGIRARAQLVGEGKVVIAQDAPQAPRATGTILGRVVNAKTKQPIAGATVMLDGATSGVTTGEDGTFRISAAAGEHALRIRAVGFVKHERRALVTDDQSVRMEILLEPSASVLNEVVVTGSVTATERKSIPTPITVITAEDIDKRGITRIDQLFRGEVPGLLAIERGADTYSTASVGGMVSSTLYSRGSASLNGGANPIKTYIDGVELLDPSYLGTIDPKSIERIEIVTGPQAATIYGSGAMGGVMQIFTKKGLGSTSNEVTVSVKYGLLQNSYSTGLTPAHTDGLTLNGGTGPDLSYSGTLSYNYTGQWQPHLFNRVYGASIGVTHTRGRLTATGSISTTSTTNGTFRSGFGQYGQIQLLQTMEYGASGLTSAPMYLNSGQVSRSSNQTGALNLDFRMTPAWQHHLTVGKSMNVMTVDPLAPGFIGTSDTLFQVTQSNGQRLTWNYNSSYISDARWLSSSLTVGANGSNGTNTQVSGCKVTVRASTMIGCFASGAPSVTIPLDDRSWGGFGSWKVGLAHQLYATFGLRLEQNANYGKKVKFDATPTNGLTYTIEVGDLSLKLLGSYGRATRPPAPSYRLRAISTSTYYEPQTWVYQFANPDLRPEKSRGPQGGFELYYGNLGSLTLNHYQQTITDLVQSIPVDSIPLIYVSDGSTMWTKQYQYMNAAKVRQKGWEGTGSLNLGVLSLRGTYSWNDSRVLEVNPLAGGTYAPGQSFKEIPTHTGNIAVSYAHGKTSVTLTNNWIGETIANHEDFLYNKLRFERIRMYMFWYDRKASLRFGRKLGYVKSDLAASHRLSAKTSLTLNMINLGNSFASEFGPLNPTLGRQTTLGVSYRFSGR